MIAFGPSPKPARLAGTRCRIKPGAGFVRVREVIRQRSIFSSEVHACSRILFAA